METEPKLQPKIEPKTDQKVEQKTEQKELQRKERQAIGTPAIDPTSDPSYDFAFRTPEYQRRENADALGRVRGTLNMFSFLIENVIVNTEQK